MLAATLTFSAEQNRVKLATHIEFPAILRLNQRCVCCLQLIHISRVRVRVTRAAPGIFTSGATATAMESECLLQRMCALALRNRSVNK